MASGNPQHESHWVYRRAELVLGPVSAQTVEKMLFEGSLGSDSEVAPAGSGNFRRVGQLERFRVVAAKAEAHRRVQAAAEAERAVRRKRLLVLGGAVAAVALVVAMGAAVAARYLAVHAPLGGSRGEAEISLEPPVIRLAQAQRGTGEELLEYGQVPVMPRAPAGSAPAPGRALASSRPPVAERSGADRARRPGPTAPGRLGEPGADGLQTGAFDQEAINRVVAAQQRTLYPCIQAAAQKDPDLTARVPIEFTIGNDGRVAQLWVDHPDLKRGELPGCLLRELQKWTFPRMEGERPSVSLAFSIGRSRS